MARFELVEVSDLPFGKAALAKGLQFGNIARRVRQNAELLCVHGEHCPPEHGAQTLPPIIRGFWCGLLPVADNANGFGPELREWAIPEHLPGPA